MTVQKFVNLIQSDNLEKNETNTLLELSCDRTDVVSGGFLDNWDSTVSTNANNSPTPFKLIEYKLRIFTTKPCVVWSAYAENLRVAKTAPAGVDTAFNQRSFANGLIKKWTQTVDGQSWSFLMAKPKGRNGRGPQKINDATWKLQVKNLNPEPAGPAATSNYIAIIEVTIDYDSTSPL